MNERIKQLAEQAGMKECSLGYGMPENVLWGENQIKEFAELIVRECIDWCNANARDDGTAQRIAEDIKKDFGVKE